MANAAAFLAISLHEVVNKILGLHGLKGKSRTSLCSKSLSCKQKSSQKEV